MGAVFPAAYGTVAKRNGFMQIDCFKNLSKNLIVYCTYVLCVLVRLTIYKNKLFYLFNRPNPHSDE